MTTKQVYTPPQLSVLNIKLDYTILSVSTEATINNYTLHDLSEE